MGAINSNSKNGQNMKLIFKHFYLQLIKSKGQSKPNKST